MTTKQTIHDLTNGNMISDAGQIPKTPITSKFVSPWDTSGWYMVGCNLNEGSRMYSNSETFVKQVPRKYLGSDFITVFNSEDQNLTDHPEVDFFVETDAYITVAMAEGCRPLWLQEWRAENEVLVSSKDKQYQLFTKQYASSEHVHIPGFDTQHDHYFVIIRPMENVDEVRALVEDIEVDNKLAFHEAREYKSHIVQVFNQMDDEMLKKQFIIENKCSIQKDAQDDKNAYLLLEDTSKATLSLQDKLIYPAIFECNITIDGAAAFAGLQSLDASRNRAGVLLKDGKIYDAFSNSIAGNYEDKETIAVKIKTNTQSGTYQIWINHRKALEFVPYDGVLDSVVFESMAASVTIDDLYVYDDTEIYLVNETFDDNFDDVLKSWETNCENKKEFLSIQNYPFEEDKSLVMKADEEQRSASYLFNPVRGLVSVETKLKVVDTGFSLAPQLSDKDGKPALKIALYKNNLYATDGNVWKRIYEGRTPWMYYPCNNWFNIKVTANTDTGTYDLFVDGAQRAVGFAFLNEVDNIAVVTYSADIHSTLYINRIRVYDCADFSRGVIPNAPLFDVKAAPYNAKGDGSTLDTLAIQQAIDDAAYTGGTVYIHDGVFFTGGLIVRSDMTLFVDTDAVILGTQDHSQYKLVQPGISLCAIRQLGRGLIYGENVSNVRITGGGTLDGNGTYRYKMNDPLENREEDARPDIIYITYSKNLLIENLNLKSSPFWTVVPLSSGNITIRNLNLDCMNTPNRDGIDPVDCHDMTIYNCNIMAGDDGLCFKTSDNVGCYNIDAYDMMIQSLASGIKFGTDTYYSLKNAHIRDCAIKNVNRCGVSLESVDGAEVDNVIFERLDMTDVGAPIYITIGKRNRLPRNEETIRWSSIKNVVFKDIRFEQPYPFSYEREIRENMIIGQSAEQAIENVSFINFDLKLPGGVQNMPEPPVTIDHYYPEYDRHGKSSGYAFTVKYAKNLTFKNIKVELDEQDIRPKIAYFDYED